MRTVASFESILFRLPAAAADDSADAGADVATWLAERLREGGATVDTVEPDGQQWVVSFLMDAHAFQAIVGPVGDEFWYVVVEEPRGLLPSLLGARHHHSSPLGVQTVQLALASDPAIRNIQWHEWADFRRGGNGAFSHGAGTPTAP